MASSATNTIHSFSIMALAWSATSAGNRVAATISSAFASSTPTSGSMEIFATASGFSTAVTSISTPPSIEAMHR